MKHLDEGLLQAWLDGDQASLTFEEREAVEAHLDDCPECTARLQDLRTCGEEASDLLATLAAFEREAPPFDDVVARARALEPGRARPVWRTPMAWAASIVIALGAGWLANEWTREGAPPFPSPPRVTARGPATGGDTVGGTAPEGAGPADESRLRAGTSPLESQDSSAGSVMAARSELGSVPTLVTRVDDSDSLAYVLNGFIAPVATSPREGPPLSPPILVRDSSQSPLDMIDPKDLTLIVVAGRSSSASADSGVAFRLDGFIVDPETDSTRTVGDVASIVGATLPEAGEWPPLSDPILVGDSFPHPLDVIDPSELTLVAGNGAAPSPSGSPDQSIRGADVPPIPEERAEPGPRAVIEGAPGTPSMRYAIRPVLVPEPGESAGWRAVSLEEAERVARFRPRTVPGRAIASVWVGTFQLNQVVAVVQDLPDDRQMTLFQSLNPVVGEGSGVSGSIRLEGGRLTVFGRADVPPESLRALLESLR